MSSYTNVHIDDGSSRIISLVDEIEMLNFKLGQANKKISGIQRELENIPKAVKEWGYVDITYENETIRLVVKS